MNICFYFQVHQPYRMKRYKVFDIGSDNYFDEEKNKEIMLKVARKCYLPTNKLLLKLIKEHKGEFKVSFSISGVALEQFEEYAPEVLQSFKDLAKTGCVEFLSETYYHSLSYLYSKDEFQHQVKMHQDKIKKLFNQKPKVFRNTELIYNNELANYVEGMGYQGIIAEGADHILDWRSPNYVYKAKNSNNLKLFLKNYKLSDDIAFRFSQKSWEDHPLTVDKFINWVNSTEGETLNLFMDYETFGEHQWEDTGIFEFLENLPREAFKHNIGFHTPSEMLNMQHKDEVDIHNFISWADMERDLSAWLGNDIQKSAAAELYKLEKYVKESKNPKLVDKWRKLTTSDHLYYMCTKWFNDGDVHKYFNPYDSPYESFIAFMNIMNDLVGRLNLEIKESSIAENPSQLLRRGENEVTGT